MNRTKHKRGLVAIATEAFKYWAFVSYSHADEAFARKLHVALEHYTLPWRLRKAHSLPRRLIPVFRDIEELEASSGLTNRLQEALDQSRWLIVLCSPVAAKSKYVNSEIEYFVSKHGARRVLCALVEGEPADSFPAAIKALDDEPLAADFRAGGDFGLGRLKLIAAMAAVGFTEIRNREAQRRNRLRMTAAAAVGALGIGALAYWDLFHRVHVDCFVNYVRRNGIWEGVDPISNEKVSHRALSYRFTRHGRLSPPERVEAVNGSGGCADGLPNILGENHSNPYVPLPDPYCAVAFSYARDGNVRQESLLNRFGVAKESLTYTAEDIAQLTQQGFDAPSKGSGVRFVQFTRDDRGLETAIRFLYSRGVLRPNQDHHFGYALAYDPNARLVSRSALDDQGAEVGEVTRYAYTQEGALAEERSEDNHGKLRVNQFGYATKLVDNDTFGNALRWRYQSIAGKPTDRSGGYASVSFSHDLRGNLTSACYFDVGGGVARGENGTPCEHWRYDEQGGIVRIELTDADGKPMMSEEGAAAFSIQYGDQGRSLDMQVFDALGKTAEGREGIAGMHLDYDARGNSVSRDFFDGQGHPVLSSVGAHVRMKFDERDNQVEFLMLGVDGKPFAPHDAGYAARRTLYDERGNTVEIQYLDTDMKLVAAHQGFAVVRFTLDEFGNRVEVHRLDASRHPVRDIDGVAIYRHEFDQAGRSIQETYFDEHGEPTLHRKGYYGARTEFDNLGRETAISYLDAHRNVARVAALGYAGVRNVYDGQGRLIELNYFDPQGAPLRDAPVTREVYKRDDYGNELQSSYFNAAGHLAVSPATGCAMETKEYDSTTSLTAERCLDVNGQAANRKDSRWATRRITLEHGRTVKDEYFDSAGTPIKARK